MGHFFTEWAKEEFEGTGHLLQMQNQLSSHALLQDVEKPSQDEWDKSQDGREATMVMEPDHEKSLNQAFLDLHAWVLLA